MSTKKTGGSLASFAVSKTTLDATPPQVTADSSQSDQGRQRGKRAMVSLTVRVSRDQWQRIHELALHEGKSINAMAIEGISRLFEDKGLKSL